MRNVLRRIRGRQRCRRPRIISRPFVLEPLEDRLLLSLTVGNIQVPLVGYDSTGRTAYDPVARLFQVTATPLLLKEANGLPSRRIEPGPAVSAHLDMRALVSHTGDLLGTVDGDDLVLTGSIDLDGDGVPDHSGVLLTGEAIGFGHLNLGLTDKFDLRFTLTGGALAGLYGGNDLGVVVTAENSTFNGSFSTAFTGGAKGSIGSLPRSGAAIYLEKRTESFDADDPDGPDVPHIAPPGAGTSAGDDDHGLVELWAGIGAIDAALVLGGRAATVLPWSTIDRIGARFDRPVDIGPADLQVAGVNVPRYAITGFDYDAVTHVATWALGAPISTDRVLVTLLGSHSVRFDVVPGDLDGDGAATVHDITHLRRGLEAPVAAQALPAHADINLDGAVSTLDVLSLRQNLGATLPHGEPVGSLAGTVTWTYEVLNTGSVPFALADVRVVDDNATPANAGDDFEPVLVAASDDGADGMLAPGETWLYTATRAALDLSADHPGVRIVPGCDPNGTGITRPTYENIARVTAGFVSDTDLSHYCNPAAPAIDIEKHTDGADADDPFGTDVPRIAPGAHVNWTFLVSNTGNVPFPYAAIDVADDHPAITPLLDGASDDGADLMLAPGETWIYRAGAAAGDLVADPTSTTPGVDPLDPRPTYVNVARVAALHDGISIEDQDASHYANPDAPAIDIEKHTNGADADDPFAADVPRIAPGAAVEWTFQVTNTGNIPFTFAQIEVTDDAAVAPLLDGASDGGADGVLAPGERWIYRAGAPAADLIASPAGTVPGIDPLDPRPTHVNIARVAATRGGAAVEDQDPSHYANPDTTGIRAQAMTNGASASDPFGATVPRIAVGATVTWTYHVTNSGNVALAAPVVTDDNGTPQDGADDFRPAPILDGDANVGDTNRDGLLDPGETWQYRHTGTALDLADPTVPTVPGQDALDPRATFENVVIAVTARANDIDPDAAAGADGADDGRIVASDLSHYGNPEAPAIHIESSTNGADADEPFGPDVPRLPAGETILRMYQVTNSGNAALSDVSVVDDNGTPTDLLDDFEPQPLLVQDANVGDADGDGRLDVGETWVFSHTLDSVDLIRDGVPTVPGIDPDRQRPTFRAVASATARRGSTIVQDTDQTHYANPDETAIAIEKTTNGADADDPFGADVPRIATGDAVTWTYHVTNGGNVPFWLDEITVTDDQSDVAPVFDPTSDVGGDEILSPGETWRYAATGTALALSDFPPAMQLGRTIGQTNVYPVLAGGAILTPAVFSFVVEGEGTILTSLALRLSIEHEYTDDLDVFLIAPDGTRHLIIDDVPGTNFQDTLLDDAADRSILDEEEGPHAGAFRPEGALSQFDGVDPNGTWLLQIFDDTPADDGVLFAPGQVASWGPVIGTQLLITSTNENPTTVPGCDPATPRSTYENLGTVLVAGGPSASDLSHYCNPAVSGLSVSRGVAAAASAGPAGEGGATPVTFVYAVGNTGETPLHDIHIYDDPRDGTSAVAFRPSALLAGSRNVGDVNGDGLLDLDETWLYTYTRSLGTGLFSSLVTVMARDPGGSLVATAAESFYLHL